LAGLAVALSLWVIAARASAGSPAPASGVPTSPSAADASPFVPPLLSWETVASFPHDTQAWTEGLLIDAAGRLYESTGIVGRSSVRELDRMTGKVLRSAASPDDVYGEGLAVAGDQLLQLTWKDGVALAWDPGTLEVVGSHAYPGEGWGLCSDGQRLVMSDGSATLTFRDLVSFEPTGSVQVTAAGQPVVKLNELECVDGLVWANVWETPYIVRIDPATGLVTGVLDMTGLAIPDPSLSDPGAVLNGIAHDAEHGTFLLTGKLWPTMYEVRIAG
jgi:glutaminyl-peptide cyclotransferase